MRLFPALLVWLATLSSAFGALLVLRLNADSGSLLQVINTNRSDLGRRIRLDSDKNIYVIAGQAENTTVLKYSPSGVLVTNFGAVSSANTVLQEALSVATVNNVTYVSSYNSSNALAAPALHSFSANGSFAGSITLNISTFIDGSSIPTSGFFDMRADGEVIYLATSSPVGFLAWNTSSGLVKATKFGQAQLFPVAMALLDDLVVTWTNSSTDALLLASPGVGSDPFEPDLPVSVPDRSAIVGLDSIGGRLITFDSKRGVFKRISAKVPVWSDYVSVAQLGVVYDFTVDSDGNLLVLVDRSVVPVDYCGSNILDCNEKTTRCVASLTSGRCQCLPGFSATDLADNFCLPGCSNETCSDGSCVLSISECPPVQACSPSKPKRCPRGDCVPVDMPCSAGKVCPTGLQLCVDGACRKDCSTAPFAGCPRYTCPDGTCTSRYDACKGCNETGCSGPAPSAVFPYSQSFKPYAFSIISSGFTIGLPSISVISDYVLARFSFPDGFVALPQAQVSFAEASTLKYRDFFNQKQIASKIVSLVVENGTTPFTATVALLAQIPDGRSDAQIRFSIFNSDTQTWKYLSSPSPSERLPNGQFYVNGTITQSGDYAITLDASDFPGWGIFLIVLGGVIILLIVVILIVQQILKRRKKA
eukprot:TRINITY_DN942_c0_g1_i1.p1 TRINITY_DN942_c0_g1~~TRINITY_DN942_c0_g1_i1.p1  ORF type:complete len:646 (+),score=66.92 TRINITY_DN942_c0_g1_i1:196-2133(+)